MGALENMEHENVSTQVSKINKICKERNRRSKAPEFQPAPNSKTKEHGNRKGKSDRQRGPRDRSLSVNRKRSFICDQKGRGV